MLCVSVVKFSVGCVGCVRLHYYNDSYLYYSDVIAIYKPPVCRLLELNYPVFMVLSLCIWLMLSFSKKKFCIVDVLNFMLQSDINILACVLNSFGQRCRSNVLTVTWFIQDLQL